MWGKKNKEGNIIKKLNDILDELRKISDEITSSGEKKKSKKEIDKKEIDKKDDDKPKTTNDKVDLENDKWAIQKEIPSSDRDTITYKIKDSNFVLTFKEQHRHFKTKEDDALVKISDKESDEYIDSKD